MNIIFLGKNQGSHSVNLTPKMLALLAGVFVLFLFGILFLGAWGGYALKSQSVNTQEFVAHESSDQQSDQYVNVLSARVAELQARLMRLDALGKRLVKGAKLDDGEFDFDTVPGQGGDDLGWEGEAMSRQELENLVTDLSIQVDNRSQQLEILDDFIVDKELSFENYLSGLPVKGSVTSDYGYRIHPISGRRKMHSGIDIAASYGTDIVVPGSGMVTYSGWRGGYGRVVEVDHGDGMKTRYAHNNLNLVDVGEVVNKGDLIAYVGSSGRSTGPHVHFEVIKNGKAVNPWHYILSTGSVNF